MLGYCKLPARASVAKRVAINLGGKLHAFPECQIYLPRGFIKNPERSNSCPRKTSLPRRKSPMTIGPVWFGGSIQCEWVPQALGASQRLAALHQSEAWAEHEHLLGEFLPSDARWKVPIPFSSALHTQEECASLYRQLPRKQRVDCSHFW